MFIFNKKRLSLIVICILLAIFSYAYEGSKMKIQDEKIPVTATPVSGKTVVLDAGHGVPDERSTK